MNFGLGFLVISKTLNEAEMKLLVLIAAAFLATAAHGRYVEEELVATPWMDRVWLDEREARIFRGDPGELICG